MLEFVIGLPGPFGRWCAEVVTRLVEPAGPVPVIHANTLDQVSLGLIKLGISQAVISSAEPGGRLRATLSTAGRPFILSTEDPRAVFCHLVAEGASLREAIRKVASSCAAVIGCIGAPGALALRADSHARDPLAAAAAIASHLDLPRSESEIAQIVDGLGSDGILAAPWDWESLWSGQDEAARAAAIGALGPYAQVFDGNAIEPLHWAPFLFTIGDEAAQPLLGPIDITGRARCLFCGPNILVPAGSWSLLLELALSPEAAEHEYLIEISGCTEAPAIQVRPPRAGHLEGRVDFLVDETSDDPISIRFLSGRAAFDGTLSLVGATVVPRHEITDPEDSRSEFLIDGDR